VARFRLRYKSTDLEVPPGEFFIGRSSSCHLALDDGLVSRRHAVLRAQDDSLEVEDLGSRNGVSVNGKRIEGATPLRHLDRVTIGSQEMVVVRSGETRQAATLQMETCAACGALNETDAVECVRCHAPLRGEGVRTTLQNLPAATSPGEVSTFHLLGGIAEKALALGRYEEAERVLSPALKKLAESALAERALDERALLEGIGYALRLAEGPHASRWIDWVFEMHQVTARVMDAKTLDRLHELVRRSRYANAKPLRAYLLVLEGKVLAPAERFLLRRLEGLERVIRA
tara:strand:+ start:1759 stop:2619 length:861 start_codon:yes stop_codon:yes gene_type:complete